MVHDIDSTEKLSCRGIPDSPFLEEAWSMLYRVLLLLLSRRKLLLLCHSGPVEAVTLTPWGRRGTQAW